MRDLSILLVEDNPDDEWLALRTLKKMGLDHVAVARDGFDALSLLNGEGGAQSSPFAPDLVLLDLKLPKIDGIEVLRRLRLGEPQSELNVVVVTSCEDPHALATCRELKALGCLSKPILPEQLIPILGAVKPQCNSCGKSAVA